MRLGAYARIELPVEEGDQGKVIGGIIFALPEDLGLVGEWISDGSEAAF